MNKDILNSVPDSHISFLLQSIINMALNLTVKVHPVVLFQIVDAYERRKAESLRVIGTLLGNTFTYHEQ